MITATNWRLHRSRKTFWLAFATFGARQSGSALEDRTSELLTNCLLLM
ncbi:MAG TPA: hypothetical protein V6C85_22995 [Allocoleopsis sp.]